MKRRWPFFALAAGCLVAGLGWFLRPIDSPFPSEVSSQLTRDKRLPHAFMVGAPPTGTTWEMYVVPVAYARITEAMKSTPGWRVSKGEFMGAKTRAMYRSTDPAQPRAIDVMPGRFAILDLKAARTASGLKGENYSILAIAVPKSGTLREAVLQWIAHLRGRPTPPLPTGAVFAYLPPSPQELSSAANRPARGKPSSQP